MHGGVTEIHREKRGITFGVRTQSVTEIVVYSFVYPLKAQSQSFLIKNSVYLCDPSVHLCDITCFVSNKSVNL
jgi:hypothetical protein